jgi:phosphatidylserine/phosphatidylglycerophosphate/cardiolipin synthase-like enzyme
MRDGAVFPWRGGNRFALLVDGPVYFPRMLAAIDRAERQVELELYLVEDGECATRLVDTLIRAAARGVRVRCLFDAFGSLKLGSELRQRLADAGGELRLYNRLGWRRGLRNLFRDHRKLLLVDDRLGYIGGAGATDEFWNPQVPEQAWHEVMVEFSGPVLDDWRELFEFQWRCCVERRFWWPSQPLQPARLPPSPARGDGMGRVAYAAARQHRDILRALIRSLATARERVWLATPYFLPTWKVRRSLAKAARRGADVRLLLCGRCTDHPPVRFAGQRYYPRLLRAGVRIFEYQPRFSHMKMVLVDDWVTVGSCNFDHWNLRWNLEGNLETLDREMTLAAADCLHADFEQSREITLQDWYERPLLKRIYQRLWGMLDRLVVNVLERNQ